MWKSDEERRLYYRERYASNKEAERERLRRSYAKHREQRIKDSTLWIENNRSQFNDNQNRRRWKNKLKAVAYLGGKCNNCGGVFPPRVYDFHHRDPATKDVSVNVVIRMSWDKIQKELDKCDLLCANCHRLVHNIGEDLYTKEVTAVDV